MQHDPSIVNLLDKAGNALNTGGDQTMSQQQANEFIVQFFQREDSFQCAIPIFTESKVGIIKFAALNVLRDTARLKWDSLPEEFQMNVRFFALNLIPQYVINVSQGQIRTSFLSTIDLILIEIAKHEWPQKWNTFFSDVMNFTTRDFCYNSLSIISMLLSEITEFAEDSLTSLRADEMTRALSNEIEGILNFIHNCVNDQDIELSKNALTTLKKLLRIPNTVQVLISTEWVQQLLTNYMGHPKLAVPVIGLFAEFVSKSCTDDQVIPLFITLVNSLQQAIGDDFALVSDLSGDDQFSNGFVSAILAIFKRHENVLKVNEILPQLQQVLQWVYIVTVGSSQDLFEECITFWQYMLWYLACESEGGRIKVPEMYPILMHQISVLLIERMPTPIDMINVLDEDGKMRQIINNKRTFGNFFSTAKECLIFLTRLNSNDIKSVILERLNELYNGLNVDSIRSLCWAIGCIAGVSTDMENELLPKVLTILFSICQQIENPKDCALVAEGTVFVCGQYYKFMDRFPNLLKVVIGQIINNFIKVKTCMLQEYSLDTLKTYAKFCRKWLSVPQQNEEISTLQFFLQNIEPIINELKPDNIPIFYEIISLLVQGVLNNEVKSQITDALVNDLMTKFNQVMSSFNPENIGTYQYLIIIIKCCSQIPLYLGSYFIKSFIPNIQQILGLYLTLSQIINNNPEFLFRVLRSEIITLLRHMILYSDDINIVIEYIFKPIKDPLLDDYLQNTNARTPEVLTLFSDCFHIFKSYLNQLHEEIFFKLIVPTFEMIINHLESTVEFKFPLFALTKSFYIAYIPLHCNEFNIQVLDFIINIHEFGCSQNNIESSIFCLNSLSELFSFIEGQNEEFAQAFLERYSMRIVVFALRHFFDLNYKSSFQTNTTLIKRLLSLNFVRNHAGDVANCLCEMFQNHSQKELFDITETMFNVVQLPLNNFFKFMKDLLVMLQQISCYDPDLNNFEREQKIQELNRHFGYRKEIDENNQMQAEAPVLEMVNNISALTIQ